LRGTHGIPFLRRDHGDEVFFAHDPRTGDALDRARVYALHFARSARRTQHACVQHSRYADVGDELVRAVHLPRDIASRQRLADDFVFRRRLRLRRHLDVHRIADLLVPLHLVIEVAAADQIGVGGAAFRAGDDAIGHAKLPCRRAELLGCTVDEHSPCFRGRTAHEPSAVRHASAAGRTALVAGGARITHHHFDLVGTDVELVGDDLGHRDIEALPHVHLAEERLHVAVGEYGDP
jgi:hypothetical protein